MILTYPQMGSVTFFGKLYWPFQKKHINTSQKVAEKIHVLLSNHFFSTPRPGQFETLFALLGVSPDSQCGLLAL